MDKPGHAVLDKPAHAARASRKPAIVTPTSLQELAVHLSKNREEISTVTLGPTPSSLLNSFTMDVGLPVGDDAPDQTEHMRALLAYATRQSALYNVVHTGDFIPSGENGRSKTTIRHFKLDVDEGDPFRGSHRNTYMQLRDAIEEIMKASPDELEELAKKINAIQKTGEREPGASGPGYAF